MHSYHLRNIDPDVWRRVKSRAAYEGRTVQDVLLECLIAYARDFKALEERRPKKPE